MTQKPADAHTDHVIAHVINHTHWDREWFLTHEYTTEWIPALIDNIERIAGEHPDYRYLFDGQTLVIEDLLDHSPGYRPTVERLVRGGQLQLGPIYSQPDWRLVCGELHLRNLRFGAEDVEALGGTTDVAWLVDTFGHLSQAPQMLALAGVDGAYVWRGVPAMLPVFDWTAPDGSTVTTVDLFGGYRNLYGIEKTESIAVDRLVAEVDKLRPHYGSTPIPLFDGYDLDTEPEDPARFYAGRNVPQSITLAASTPRTYLDAVADIDRPTIAGELLSGKFGATFPGSLSARASLKVLHHDAEQALLARAEPLAVLATAAGQPYDADRYVEAARELLRNGVHDCICGVSIDPVHERMERSYRRLLNELSTDIERSVAVIVGRAGPGVYSVSSTPMATDTTQRIGDRVVVAPTAGLGVWPVAATHEVELVDADGSQFVWTNDHYRAASTPDGVMLDGRLLARLVVTADHGDTYSSEPGDVLGTCRPTTGPVVESRSAVDAVVRYDVELAVDDGVHGPISVTAQLRYRFDSGALVHIDVELDSTGTGFRVELEIDTGIESERVHAAMPFDLVDRPHRDSDLLPLTVDAGLAAVLMGQREVETVDEFPCHEFVAMRSTDRAVIVLGQGTRSYRSDDRGRISLSLRRSVEWLARTGLSRRSGDAGPAMYVPGARDERSIRHRLGVGVLPSTTDDLELWRLSRAFHTPPLIAEVTARDEPADVVTWPVAAFNAPSTNLERLGGLAAMRLFNPTRRDLSLPGTFRQLSLRGDVLGEIRELAPGQIATVELVIDRSELGSDHEDSGEAESPAVVVHGLPTCRVGPNRSRPDPARLDELADRLDRLADEIQQAVTSERDATGAERFRATHHKYVLQREHAEIELSLELNQRRAASDEEVSIPDERDPVIEQLGVSLNELRIRRRIYDYVVQSL